MNRLLELLGSAVLNAIDPKRKTVAVLSGGIDSSAVVCTARHFGHDLPCFTGFYEDGPEWDERQWAELAAGSEHYTVKIRPEDFVEHFDRFASVCKPPYQGMGAFGQYMVAKTIAAYGAEVVLSGEGSDELFGGYARQYIVAGLPRPDGYEDYELPWGYPGDLKQALDYDYRRLRDLLAVDDQMLGAFGLKGRAPFTDQAVVDFALALPVERRVGKPVLKEAMRGIVPDKIIDRTDKRGFPAPYVSWAQEEPVRSFVLDRIGKLPDPNHPWDRNWFNEMIARASGRMHESWEVAV